MRKQEISQRVSFLLIMLSSFQNGTTILWNRSEKTKMLFNIYLHGGDRNNETVEAARMP